MVIFLINKELVGQDAQIQNNFLSQGYYNSDHNDNVSFYDQNLTQRPFLNNQVNFHNDNQVYSNSIGNYHSFDPGFNSNQQDMLNPGFNAFQGHSISPVQNGTYSFDKYRKEAQNGQTDFNWTKPNSHNFDNPAFSHSDILNKQIELAQTSVNPQIPQNSENFANTQALEQINRQFLLWQQHQQQQLNSPKNNIQNQNFESNTPAKENANNNKNLFTIEESKLDIKKENHQNYDQNLHEKVLQNKISEDLSDLALERKIEELMYILSEIATSYCEVESFRYRYMNSKKFNPNLIKCYLSDKKFLSVEETKIFLEKFEITPTKANLQNLFVAYGDTKEKIREKTLFLILVGENNSISNILEKNKEEVEGDVNSNIKGNFGEDLKKDIKSFFEQFFQHLYLENDLKRKFCERNPGLKDAFAELTTKKKVTPDDLRGLFMKYEIHVPYNKIILLLRRISWERGGRENFDYQDFRNFMYSFQI